MISSASKRTLGTTILPLTMMTLKLLPALLASLLVRSDVSDAFSFVGNKDGLIKHQQQHQQQQQQQQQQKQGGLTRSMTTLMMSQRDVLSSSSWSSSSPLSSASSKEPLMSTTTRRETIKMPSQTPMVPWTPKGAERAQFVDLYSAMYRDRTLMISKFIDEAYANEIIAIILWMRKEDPRQDISIYFNVPGALMRPALAIYDLLEQTKEMCDIETVNLGLCAGMGSFLCAAGTKGRRSAMPNSRFLLQRTGLDQPFRGQATDIVLEVKNIRMWNDRTEKVLAELTGQPMEKIQKDLKRDFYLSSDEAVQYGLIDQVLLPAPLKRAARGQAADLGAFEGDDEQRYQGQDNNKGGGWGSQQQAPPREERKDDDDDDGPKIMKG